MIALIDHHHCPPLVLYHHRLSASGGHYTLDVLHLECFLGAGLLMIGHQGWVGIDDKIVSEVRPEDVFGAVSCTDGLVRLEYIKGSESL
jgi:hypothetical protein